MTRNNNKQEIKCAFCKGTGVRPRTTTVSCTVCEGKGNVTVARKAQEVCPKCNGTGAAAETIPCTQCGGKGVVVCHEANKIFFHV